MQMFVGKTPVKSLNIKHYELSTNDCDMVASDLQAGKTAVARGKKITGTGKSFEFAEYGGMYTNFPLTMTSMINVVEIASTVYPIKLSIALSDMKSMDFSNSQTIGSVVIDEVTYPIVAITDTDNATLTLSCDETISLQVFYGKDNYV